ncbi:MAG TPA: RNA-binding S4 domain-containing protein [Burkholderiales bacterium]|jgi:ribosome-associated heat shock protein Hsp15|nr:RNA-binding S4 domain-containing protein [Burkholderiales bacterium]
MEKVRVDKWLWAARFYKTRSLATDACDGNKVKVNDANVKPAKDVRPGDLVRFSAGWFDWEVEVLAISDKRGAAAIAQTLYRETDASAQGRAAESERRRKFTEPAAEIVARPTKRDRRTLDKWRSG